MLEPLQMFCGWMRIDPLDSRLQISNLHHARRSRGTSDYNIFVLIRFHDMRLYPDSW